jgi:hypothetical protein
LALATHAHAMTDAEMKALLTGTWTNHCDDKTIVFQADGKWQVGADDIDPIINGISQKEELLEIRPEPWGVHSTYTILLLTKHEFLAQLNARDGERSPSDHCRGSRRRFSAWT